MSKPSKKLQDKWTKKLKSYGFEDIEDDKGRLKKWTVTHLNKLLYQGKTEEYTPELTNQRFSSKRDYFALAGQFLHEYKFKTKLQEKIWQLHAEGLSFREIEAKTKSISKTHAALLIGQLVKEMLKLYAIRSD